jgi:hypothetical protein
MAWIILEVDKTIKTTNVEEIIGGYVGFGIYRLKTTQ